MFQKEYLINHNKKPCYAPPNKEQLEEVLKAKEIKISEYNELYKNSEVKEYFNNIVCYLEGEINILLYVLGYH